MKKIQYILMAALAASCGGKEKKAESAVPATGPNYAVVKVEKASISQTIKLPAQLAAYQEVSIFPKVNGYVRQVLVDIGSRVRKGQLLMELEAPELDQAAIQAREKYERAKLDYTISRENYERLLRASQTPGAISPMGLASAKAKADADSTFCNAERASWQMQQTILGYLHVRAPFDGVIAERNVHPGALVSAAGSNKPMLDLRQVERLRLQVDIPESITGSLKDRDTVSFFLSAYPGRRMTGHVNRRSGLVNVQYRSERMEIDVPNGDGKLAPGMYADVLFQSDGNVAAYAVPRSSVVTSTERKYVLAVRDGKTIKIDVTTGNETADKIEVVGALRDGDAVIVHASDEIKEGLTVK